MAGESKSAVQAQHRDPVPSRGADDGGGPVADREIRATREFCAPRELVFRMWSDPQHIARWWGPRGFTTTTHSMDFRTGGVWRFTMHGPDGTDYPNRIEYVAVERPARLVYRHVGNAEGPEEPVRFAVNVEFEDLGERTRLHMVMVFESREARDEVEAKYGAVQGLYDTMDRLTETVARETAASGAGARPDFVTARVFDAPRELVYAAWTQREHLLQWWGPKDFKVASCDLDLRPGGRMHYLLKAGDREVWGLWVFQEVIPPARLVFASSFSDPQGEIARAPFPGDWPPKMLTTVTFAEQGRRTVVTLAVSVAQATAAQQKTFTDARDSMHVGWGGTFDQLAAYLAGRRSPTG